MEVHWVPVTIDWPWMVVAVYVALLALPFTSKLTVRLTREVVYFVLLGIRSVLP